MCLVESWTNIDWAATGTMMQGVGTLGGAVAVYAAARMGLSAWKHQKLAERNRDQAEVILHAAYNARRALGYLRSPWMSGGELAAAEEKLNSSEPKWRNSIVEEKQKRLITAQAYYMRANQLLDDRTKLEDCLPMARALFGERRIDLQDHGQAAPPPQPDARGIEQIIALIEDVRPMKASLCGESAIGREGISVFGAFIERARQQ